MSRQLKFATPADAAAAGAPLPVESAASLAAITSQLMSLHSELTMSSSHHGSGGLPPPGSHYPPRQQQQQQQQQQSRASSSKTAKHHEAELRAKLAAESAKAQLDAARERAALSDEVARLRGALTAEKATRIRERGAYEATIKDLAAAERSGAASSALALDTTRRTLEDRLTLAETRLTERDQRVGALQLEVSELRRKASDKRADLAEVNAALAAAEAAARETRDARHALETLQVRSSADIAARDRELEALRATLVALQRSTNDYATEAARAIAERDSAHARDLASRDEKVRRTRARAAAARAECVQWMAANASSSARATEATRDLAESRTNFDDLTAMYMEGPTPVARDRPHARGRR